jgi:hypothetical protein
MNRPRGRSVRSPFSAPSASVISASSISCITARTISRRPSGPFENSSLTAAIAGIASLLVMAGSSKGIGDFDITSLS